MASPLFRTLLCFLFTTVGLVAGFTPAQAGSAVVIWPVDPTIQANQQSTALWVENRGKDPVTLQVRSFAWTQKDGDEDYQPQNEVVMSPPIADVPAGGKQLVRVIRRGAAAAAGEQAYRLLIDELPKPIDGGPEGQVSATLSVQIRYSIPLFTYGANAAGASKLVGRTIVQDGKRYIEVRNEGARHARLTDLVLRGKDKTVTIAAGLAGYVLPGAAMRWAVPVDAPLDGVAVAHVNGTEQPLSAAI